MRDYENMLPGLLRRHNPWLEHPQQQTELLKQSLPSRFVLRDKSLKLREGRASLVIGPRQAGKSTWIRQQLSQQSRPVLLLCADEPLVREICRSPAVALATLSGWMTSQTLLFFEEVQRLEEAGLFLKGLVDLEPQRLIVATGSSSFHLQAQTRESLAGRSTRSELLPFSLQEIAKHEIPSLRDESSRDVLPAIQEARHEQIWSRMLRFGGYPEPWLDHEPEELLSELAESFVLKDVSDQHDIQRPEVFRRLLQLVAADIGGLANLAKWATITNAAHETVSRYLELASESHIIGRIRAFAGGNRAEITSAHKFYFIDNGLRNTFVGGFAPLSGRVDVGQLWENAVFAELVKRVELLDELMYWRSKGGAEVDFVLRRRDRLMAVEVKATRLGRPKLSRGARSFIEAYRPETFVVVNASLHCDQSVNGVPVLYRRIWDLDLSVL